MALLHHPKAGAVLVCAYWRDAKEPEMVKERFVVLISPRLPYRNNLCTVVPLSTTAPLYEVPYVHRLSTNPDPAGDPNLPVWAKCDMLATVAFHRLDRIKLGRGKYAAPQLNSADLLGIRKCVLHGLGLPALTQGLESTTFPAVSR